MKILKSTILSNKKLALIILTAIFSMPMVSQAELKISTTRADGETVMEVYNDKQKELPPAQLGISPANISDILTLSKGKLDKSIILYNYGNSDKNIQLSLLDLDVHGKPTAPSETTLRPWTLLNPTDFTIPAGGQQTIRLSIRPPMEFAQGNYKSILMIEQKVNKAITYDKDGEGLTLKLGSRYGLPINITVK